MLCFFRSFKIVKIQVLTQTIGSNKNACLLLVRYNCSTYPTVRKPQEDFCPDLLLRGQECLMFRG